MGNAVLVDGTENSWNLIYLATAVLMHKDHDVLRNLPMPSKAIRKTSSADLNPAKVKTFEQVAGKLTQKPAPEDPNELARREEQKRRMEAQDAILFGKLKPEDKPKSSTLSRNSPKPTHLL